MHNIVSTAAAMENAVAATRARTRAERLDPVLAGLRLLVTFVRGSPSGDKDLRPEYQARL